MPWRKLALEALMRGQHALYRLTRPMTLGVRGVVLDDQGRVFLVRHSYTPGWHFPGGGVEAGETALDALKRELLEEGRIALDAPPAFHGIFFNPRYSRRDHVAVYIIRAFRQIADPKPNWEIVETGFFPLEALPTQTTQASRRRLMEILEGTPPSERW